MSRNYAIGQRIRVLRASHEVTRQDIGQEFEVLSVGPDGVLVDSTVAGRNIWHAEYAVELVDAPRVVQTEVIDFNGGKYIKDTDSTGKITLTPYAAPRTPRPGEIWKRNVGEFNNCLSVVVGGSGLSGEIRFIFITAPQRSDIGEKWYGDLNMDRWTFVADNILEAVAAGLLVGPS
jgi:hypothetical protein